jgi:hypothetical protein
MSQFLSQQLKQYIQLPSAPVFRALMLPRPGGGGVILLDRGLTLHVPPGGGYLFLSCFRLASFSVDYFSPFFFHTFAFAILVLFP